jgi:hypothetical protein
MPAMSSKATCINCGGSNLELGSLVAGGHVYFSPLRKAKKFLTVKPQIVPIGANVCLDCGNVQLFASPKEVEAITRQTDRDPRRGFPISPKE